MFFTQKWTFLNSSQKYVKNLKEIYAFDEIQGCKNWFELIKVGKDSWNEKKLKNKPDKAKASQCVLVYIVKRETSLIMKLELLNVRRYSSIVKCETSSIIELELMNVRCHSSIVKSKTGV